jgi:hypothetical protein
MVLARGALEVLADGDQVGPARVGEDVIVKGGNKCATVVQPARNRKDGSSYMRNAHAVASPG